MDGAVGRDEQTHTERTLEHVPGGQKTILQSWFYPHIFLCVSGTKIRSSDFGGWWRLHLAPPLTHLENVMAEKYCLGIGNGRDWLRIMLSFRFVFLLDPTPGKTLVRLFPCIISLGQSAVGIRIVLFPWASEIA